MTDIHPDYLDVPATDAPAPTPAPMTTEQIGNIITPIDQVKRKAKRGRSINDLLDACTIKERPPVKPYDWLLIGMTSLPMIYERALGGAKGKKRGIIKNSVARQWIDNLVPFLRDPDIHKSTEAARRIEYIEEHMLYGDDDVEDEPVVTFAPKQKPNVRDIALMPHSYWQPNVSNKLYQGKQDGA